MYVACQLTITALHQASGIMHMCKRRVKTSGHKRPCADDVDVVPAADTDPLVTNTLSARINDNDDQADDRGV